MGTLWCPVRQTRSCPSRYCLPGSAHAHHTESISRAGYHGVHAVRLEVSAFLTCTVGVKKPVDAMKACPMRAAVTSGMRACSSTATASLLAAQSWGILREGIDRVHWSETATLEDVATAEPSWLRDGAALAAEPTVAVTGERELYAQTL